jgi:hypothetical protein
MRPHFTMTFRSFHFTTLAYPSHPHHNSLPFTAFFDDFPPTLSLRLIYHSPNPFPKLLRLQERVPKASAASWFERRLTYLILFSHTLQVFQVASYVYFCDKIIPTRSPLATCLFSYSWCLIDIFRKKLYVTLSANVFSGRIFTWGRRERLRNIVSSKNMTMDMPKPSVIVLINYRHESNHKFWRIQLWSSS